MLPYKPQGLYLNYHFIDKEFICRHCRYTLVHPELIRKLEALRRVAGRPVFITSGYRCGAYQKIVNPGVYPSPHMFGMAADITIPPYSVDQVYELAKKVGFDGIGRYYDQNFVHVDVRGYHAEWVQK